MELSVTRRVSISYIITRIFSVPFWGLLALIPFILQQELSVTPLYIAIVIALKPSASLISPYWSSWVHNRSERLISNLFWGNIIKYIPFLCFPFYAQPWFLIFSLGVYMFFSRGTMPAWMELLKQHMDKKQHKRLYGVGATIDYVGALVLPFLFGFILDHYDQSWRYLFPFSALLGMVACYFITRLPAPNRPVEAQEEEEQLILKPWKGGYKLLKQRPDFLRYQMGFFLGGAGLMLMHSVLPVYFTQVLKLSYKELLMAISTFKGIGFVLSTPLWVRWFSSKRIFSLCSIVTLIAALFPLILGGGVKTHLFVYLAYAAYGVMQGGSELCWKMAGSIFAGKSDSAPFSSFSVMAVGVRGLIFPFLGTILLAITGDLFVVLICGSLACCAASISLAFSARRFTFEGAV